jgi:hypothetical protein
MKKFYQCLFFSLMTIITVAVLFNGCTSSGSSSGGSSGGSSGSSSGGSSGSSGGAGTSTVTRFNGNYGGTITCACPGVPVATIGFSLSILNGVISVSYPQPGGGNVDSNGNAAMSVQNPSDTRGSSILSGTFIINSIGVASGGGVWEERHSGYTCPGTWAVQR